MKRLKALFFVQLALLVMLTPTLSHASDLAKEKRWAEQIEDSLFDGEPLYLKQGGSEFLSIYTPAESAKPLAVIVLHGLGAHPDWPQVIQPLRTELAAQGWSTLSLQLPVLPNDASFTDYQPILKDAAPRIAAGIGFLKDKGYKKVALVAHSLGTDMTGAFLTSASAKGFKDEIAGYVAIGAGGGAAQYLGTLTIPVLDLYGEDDLPQVLKAADAKRKSAAGNTRYRQEAIEGADHFFDGKEQALVSTVANWLRQLDKPAP